MKRIIDTMLVLNCILISAVLIQSGHPLVPAIAFLSAGVGLYKLSVKMGI